MIGVSFALRQDECKRSPDDSAEGQIAGQLFTGFDGASPDMEAESGAAEGVDQERYHR
jgi:hypothetical protein